jgi:hypothetical protein
MKIKDYKCKCGHDDFFFADKGNQKGIYCSYCGKWLKWADKDEQNLRMRQEPALDKIRAEIKEWYWQADKQALAKDPCVVDAMVDLFIRTINKYKAESEGHE